jgi:hypothetical protein
MTEQTWAGIVNAPGGNVVQGTQIAEQGDVILGQLKVSIVRKSSRPVHYFRFTPIYS